MRAIIILAALFLICVLVGWITISREPGRSSVNIETQEIREDTKDVMHSGAKLLHKAGDEVESQANTPTERQEAAPTVQ